MNWIHLIICGLLESGMDSTGFVLGLIIGCCYRRNRTSDTITVLDRPLELQELEAPRISRQSAHEDGKVVSPTQQPPLPSRRHPRYSCLLEAEWT